MNERIEKIKTHVWEYKEAYILGCVIASFTLVIMKGRHAGMQSVPDGPAKVTVRPFNFLSRNNNVVNVFEREGRGHPGYLVKCLETGQIFATQGETASIFNISPSALSSHLNGKFDNVNGYHFERLGLIAE